ncbi:oligosaccharide deacetylase HfsH [soil metagenome]
MDRVEAYTPDLSLKGKLRRRFVRLVERKPLAKGPARPMVSFTFTDAPATAVSAGAALLEERGLKGVFYIAAGLAGREGPMGRYATREETQRLATAGHEIACHTYSHLDCGPGGEARIAADLDRNLAALTEWGLPAPTNFAYPFGDVSADAKRVLGRRFDSARALHHGVIEAGSDLNQTPAVGIQGSEGEALARRWLKVAKDRKAWLILYTHDVEPAPSEWGCTADALGRIIDESLADGFEVVSVAEGLRRTA